jgi:hypothetical protein
VPIDSIAASPSPTPASQMALTGTAAPIDSVASTPSQTPAPAGGIGLGLPDVNQAENSGSSGGPSASQIILFIVMAFAAVVGGDA